MFGDRETAYQKPLTLPVTPLADELVAAPSMQYSSFFIEDDDTQRLRSFSFAAEECCKDLQEEASAAFHYVCQADENGFRPRSVRSTRLQHRPSVSVARVSATPTPSSRLRSTTKSFSDARLSPERGNMYSKPGAPMARRSLDTLSGSTLIDAVVFPKQANAQLQFSFAVDIDSRESTPRELVVGTQDKDVLAIVRQRVQRQKASADDSCMANHKTRLDFIVESVRASPRLPPLQKNQ